MHAVMNTLDTLDDPQWLRQNIGTIKSLYPETWTHLANWSPLPLLYRMKLLGVDFRTDADITRMLIRLQKLGVVQVDGSLIRRSPG